jgi:hypothetical protein
MAKESGFLTAYSGLGLRYKGLGKNEWGME